MRFEVIVNGERRCVAGLEYGVLTVGTTWMKRNPDAFSPSPYRGMTKAEYLEEFANLHVGALDLSNAKEQPVDWLKEQFVPGDEIIIRVLPPGESDKPVPRQASSCSLSGQTSASPKPKREKTGIAYSIIVPSSLRDRIHQIFEQTLDSVTTDFGSSRVRYAIDGVAELEILFSEDQVPRDQPTVLLHLQIDDGEALHERLCEAGLAPSRQDARGEFDFSVPGGISFHVYPRPQQSKN